MIHKYGIAINIHAQSTTMIATRPNHIDCFKWYISNSVISDLHILMMIPTKKYINKDLFLSTELGMYTVEFVILSISTDLSM